MPHELSGVGFFDLWHPEVMAGVLFIAALYLIAIGPRRQDWFRNSSRVPTGRAVAFLSGIAMIYLSEGTPLHILSDSYLFSAHMLQHMLLTLVMPPLLLLGLPDWMLRPVLTPRPIAAVWRFLTQPVVGVIVFNLIFAMWHFPIMYNTALVHHGFHIVEHAIYVPAALIMWWPLLSPLEEFPRPSELMQLFYVFLLGMGQIAIHSILTFADHALYHSYIMAPRLWDISPLLDQEWAGMVMNISTLLILTTALFIIFVRWSLREEAAERKLRARHQ